MINIINALFLGVLITVVIVSNGIFIAVDSEDKTDVNIRVSLLIATILVSVATTLLFVYE